RPNTCLEGAPGDLRRADRVFDCDRLHHAAVELCAPRPQRRCLSRERSSAGTSLTPRISDSFTWPFHGHWQGTWPIGIMMVLLAPLAFVPLLGYAVEATRSAAGASNLGPPPLRLSVRLLV